MANVPRTEQPPDDSGDDAAEQEPAPESGDNSVDRPWEAEPVELADAEPQEQPWPAPEVSAETHPGTATDTSLWPAPQVENPSVSDHDGPEAGEQIRRTDADRWAASFAGVGGQPEAPPRREEQASDVTQQASDVTQQAPVRADQPSWSSRVPMPTPPAEPSWRNAGSASGWGQAPSAAAPPTPNPAPPTRPWTTDVPSGFNWSSDTEAPPVAPPVSPPSRPDQAFNVPSGSDSFADSPTAQEPVDDHVSVSQGALARSAQALPMNQPPPPPPAYPSRPPAAAHQHGAGQSYGNPSFGGQYGGQQSDQPGSQSRWSAEPAAAPSSAAPPQQWHQQQQPPADPHRWQPASQQGPPPAQHMSAADLTSGSLVKPTAAVPRVGWRKVVHAVTGGAVNPGLSQAESLQRNLIERATAPVRGCHRIAVVSLKGGIGKTTTTAGLGLTLAEHRGDRVVALDANPDAGTLAERLTGQVDVTVRDLLDNVASIRSFTDVSAFTSLAARLQVLASEQDPEMSEAFSEAEYRTVADVLARYFNIVLTDSGTGLLHSAMSGTLALADSLVVVGSPSVDGASRASKTLDWLIAHGHGELVSRAVAVISTVRPATKELDMTRLREHFTARVRAVVEIPYDRHLVTGGIIDMTQLDRPTEQAFLELSAIVADGFRLPALTRTPS